MRKITHMSVTKARFSKGSTTNGPKLGQNAATRKNSSAFCVQSNLWKKSFKDKLKCLRGYQIKDRRARHTQTQAQSLVWLLSSV